MKHIDWKHCVRETTRSAAKAPLMYFILYFAGSTIRSLKADFNNRNFDVSIANTYREDG